MNNNEYVFRALAPWMAFERKDGTISPAAFKDKNGVSVEIGDGRSDLKVVNSMMSYLSGNVVKVGVSVCECADVEVFNDNSDNKFHRLLLDKNRVDNSNLRLTPSQAIYLSENFDVIIKTVHSGK